MDEEETLTKHALENQLMMSGFVVATAMLMEKLDMDTFSFNVMDIDHDEVPGITAERDGKLFTVKLVTKENEAEAKAAAQLSRLADLTEGEE